MAQNAVIQLVKGFVNRYEDFIGDLFFEAQKSTEDVVEAIFWKVFPDLPDDDDSYYLAVETLSDMIADMAPAA